MKVTKPMIECYVNQYNWLMECEKERPMSAEDFVVMGNRLCGIYDTMTAVTKKTNDAIPDEIESMQSTYEAMLTQKLLNH